MRNGDMIVSHILGGIGNQMFQYAAGRALSLAIGREHRIDLSGFANYRLHHGFELSRAFNVSVEYADTATMQMMLRWRACRLAKMFLRRERFKWLRGKKFVVEPQFNYWPEFFNLTGDCYLYGYWQSARYFKSVESVIRKDFSFREPLSGKNADLASEIHHSAAVSLHVRRGDYVSDPKNISVMQVCSLEYYRNAINYIAEHVEHPIFFIFSDDVTWVRKSLSTEYPCVYVDHNRGYESYKDMQLMSLCKHHVIANSSFSWWGAWLNANPEKLVVAPKNWFRNDNDDRDLIPMEWVRL